MLNELNQYAMTVNGKEINKEEDNKRAGRFLVDIVDNKNRPHRQWTSNLLEHFDTCNEYGWHIQSVTMFIPEKTKQFRYQPGINIR